MKISKAGFDYSALYDRAVRDAPDGSTFVEVGCWLGRSTVYLAQRIKESGKRITLWAVDHGFGSPGGSDYGLHQPVLDQYGGNVAGKLVSNLGHCGVLDVVVPVVLPSVRAAALVPDRTVQFVFVDAAHDRESVLADLAAWWPKVTTGGTIAGHDYDDHWPPVVEAVNEFFGRKDLNDPACPNCWSVTR